MFILQYVFQIKTCIDNNATPLNGSHKLLRLSNPNKATIWTEPVNTNFVLKPIHLQRSFRI